MSENSTKYGCFTTVRVDTLPGGDFGVRGWHRHVARLRGDTATLFGTSVGAEEMAAAVHEGVRDSGLDLPHLVRLAVDDASLRITVATRPVTPSQTPLRVQVVRHDRMRPEIKHTLTSPEFAVRDAAIEAGYDDGVLLGADGLLREGTTWSLVLGRPDGSWVTPAGPVLPSVTVALVGERVPILSAPVAADRLSEFDRAAALGSGRGVHAIASIGEVSFTGRVDVLREAYAAVGLEAVPA